MGAASDVLKLIEWVEAQPGTGSCDAALSLTRYAAAHPALCEIDHERRLFVGLAGVDIDDLRSKRSRGYLKSELVFSGVAKSRPALVFGHRGSAHKIPLVQAKELLLESGSLCEVAGSSIVPCQ